MMAEIVERTDGIPLFVEEMTKAVLEQLSARRRTLQHASRVSPRTRGCSNPDWPSRSRREPAMRERHRQVESRVAEQIPRNRRLR